MNTSGIPELLMAVIGPLLLIAAIAYAIFAWRKRTPLEKAAADERTYALYDRDDRQPSPPSMTHAAPSLAPDERPTEDERARAALGGVKGSPDLQPAPLTRNEREQTLASTRR
ncbi:MAG: hypothetical protein KIT85_00945 [Pseudolabrys sp.]|nr:hypothetical protein [Pseudolabrys sp.]MCW5682929.1 hypothetical protein [Pseudolabrys sp.]